MKFDFLKHDNSHDVDFVHESKTDDRELVLIYCHKVCYSRPCIMHPHVIITYVDSSWTFDMIRSAYTSSRFIVDSVQYISTFSVNIDYENV